MINIMWLIPWILLLIFLFIYSIPKIIEIFNIKVKRSQNSNHDSILSFFHNKIKLDILQYLVLFRVPIINGLILFSFWLWSQQFSF